MQLSSRIKKFAKVNKKMIQVLIAIVNDAEAKKIR